MQLLNTLSHMPFMSNGTLYFCKSEGPLNFVPLQTEFSKRLGVSQAISFQPWTLAKLVDGTVHDIDFGLAATSPTKLFCNPVVFDESISFIYDKKLWSATLDNTHPLSVVKSGVYTGFIGANLMVYSELKSPSNFVISSTEGNTVVTTSFNQILRIVPSGDNLILTGQKDGTTYSILRYSDGTADRIQVGGVDVYKCCIVGSDVIYAVKNEGFEDRYLHRNPVELIPHA